MGIAVHTFHDAQNGIPPANISANAPEPTPAGSRQSALSFFGVLYPYIEQQPLYDFLAAQQSADGSQKGFQVALHYVWWGTLTKEQKAAFSLPIYKCPSKRSGVHDVEVSPTSLDQGIGSGPCGDYAIVVCADIEGTKTSPWDRGIAAFHALCINEGIYNNGNQIAIGSAIRRAKHNKPPTNKTTGGDSSTWYPADDFNFVSDGLSNQLLVGEKFVRADKLDICDISDGTPGKMWDCPYLEGTPMGGGGVGRDIYSYVTAMNMIIAPGLKDTLEDNSMSMSYKFGGNHGNICNFLVGDGAVRAVSASTSRDILHWLGHAHDGQPYQLP
jgi:hypothetical protein